MQTEMMAQTSHRLIASDRIEGTPVRRPDGEKIGTIQRLMIDKVSGRVEYAVLRFGGFLGMGEKHLPVPWERLHYDRVRGAYQVDMTDDELRRAPKMEGFDWGERAEEIRINAYTAPPHWGAF